MRHSLIILRTAFVALTFYAASLLGANLEFHTIALTRTNAPGTSAQFNAFYPGHVSVAWSANGSGTRSPRTAFDAELLGAGVGSFNDMGLWSDAYGPVSLVAQEDGTIPGYSGIRFNELSTPPMITSSGFIAFQATITGSGIDSQNDETIWLATKGSAGYELTLVAQEGSQAADQPDGVLWNSFSSLSINDALKLVFVATLRGTGIGETNNEGIWSGYADGYRALLTAANLEPLTTVAQKGFQASSVASEVNWESFGTPYMNFWGTLAFEATLTGSGVSAQNNTGIWSGLPGSLNLLARKNSQAVGTGDSAKWNTFGSPILNDYNQIAFTATLTGLGVANQNDSGLWYAEVDPFSGQLTTIFFAREGDPANAMPSGARWASFGAPVINHALSNNSSSPACALAFSATVFGAGISSANDAGIWSAIPDETSGALIWSLVARTSQFAPGTVDNVRFISFADPVLDEESRVAFFATLSGTLSTHGIWGIDTNNSLGLMVREGQYLPVSASNSNDLRLILGNSLAMVTERRTDRNVFGGSLISFTAAFSDDTSGLFLARLDQAVEPPKGPAYADLDGVSLLRTLSLREYSGGYRELPPGRRPPDTSPRSSEDTRTGGFNMVFRTAEDTSYRIESTDDVAGRWDPVGDDFRGSGQTVAARIPLDLAVPARFYRFREVDPPTP